MAHFSMARIHTIMKSSADVESVSKESTFVITRATELFLKELSQAAYLDSNKAKKLDYKNVANVVHSVNHYDFLREMIPNKITVGAYYNILKQQCKDEDNINSDVESVQEISSDEESHTNSNKHDDKTDSNSDVIFVG